MIRVDGNLWIISDTHFGHKNIIRFSGRPENHEAVMLYEWTRLVGRTDQILHMGDVMFSQPYIWKTLVANLPGEKYLIKGNHDKQKNHFYQECGFTVLQPFIFQGHAFTHRPVTEVYPGPEGIWHTNIHGHIHNFAHKEEVDGPLDPSKQYINMCVEATDLRPVRLANVWKNG